MHLHYDEELIEAAAFLCASGKRPGVPALQVARFHREREKLYAIREPAERNTAFFNLHLEWFREWGLEKSLTDVLKEFPIMSRNLTLLAMRQARGKSDEGAELYVNAAGQRNAILVLRPESFERDTALRQHVRHEFMHLSDMLEPAFGYAPVLDLPGLNGAQQRIARERYRLLWDITIDGRLAGAGRAPTAAREQYAAAFARSYAFWPEERRQETFTALWQNPAPRHEQLLALIADPRGLLEGHQSAPGGACPLCDFPTFAWADAQTLPARILARIASEFPAWSIDQGICRRCLETYEAAVYA